MSTRANIARKNTDGSFDVIYTHWDGYPEHHAPILLEHYNTPQRVAMLLELGDLSSLAEKIGERHDFNNPPNNVCNAYGRDRGEQNAEAKHYKDAIKFADMLKEAWTEWIYVYVASEGEWYFTNNPSPNWFKCCGITQENMQRLEHWNSGEISKDPSRR